MTPWPSPKMLAGFRSAAYAEVCIVVTGLKLVHALFDAVFWYGQLATPEILSAGGATALRVYLQNPTTDSIVRCTALDRYIYPCAIHWITTLESGNLS